MIRTRIRNRNYRLIFDLRWSCFVAILSGFFIISGCGSVDSSEFKSQAVIEVEWIQPFQLEKSYKYDWRMERPEVKTGLLVVIKVDPNLVTPKNLLEPVLYAGNQTVQRLNHGHESGYVIGIIPEQIDLSQEPIWFGSPALPERVDKDMIAKERTKAERSGIAKLKSSDIKRRTKDPVVAATLTQLLREYAADLVLEFSPKEKHLADSWRLPVTGSK